MYPRKSNFYKCYTIRAICRINDDFIVKRKKENIFEYITREIPYFCFSLLFSNTFVNSLIKRQYLSYYTN